MAKSIYKSKTVWVALLLLIGSVLQASGILQLDLNENAPWIGVALSVIQIVLRLITKEPVELNDKSHLKLPVILFMFLFITGCCGKDTVKEVVQNKTVSVTLPAQDYTLQAGYANIPAAEYEAAFMSLPESTCIGGANEKAEVRYYPKKKFSTFTLIPSGSIRHSATRQCTLPGEKNNQRVLRC